MAATRPAAPPDGPPGRPTRRTDRPAVPCRKGPPGPAGRTVGCCQQTSRFARSKPKRSRCSIVETAAIIWMILLIAVAAATALLALPRRPIAAPAGHRTGQRRAGRPRAGKPAFADKAADRVADQLAEQAVARAHERAAAYAAEVARRREDWLRAQEAVDATWAAFDAADRDARRAAAAAAFPILKQRRTRAELADRERNLHRMTTAACRRRELSIAQLNEALAHRGGWNPRRHPVAQEATLRAAVREHRYAAYQAATGQERQAWQEAEQAAATLRSFRAELLTARVQADRDVHYQQQWTPARSAKARLAVR